MSLLAAWQLAQANRESMNIEGSFQHIFTDVIGFIATAIAGIVILATGWTRADGIAALFIAAVMLRAAYHLLRSSGRVLLEAAPPEWTWRRSGRRSRPSRHVENVHDLHVWEISSRFPALSAHVLVGEGEDCHGIRRQLERMLDARFDIEHTTLQVDHARDGDALVQIEATSARSRVTP